MKQNKNANSVAEEIASRDRNNLYIASSFFEDREKYNSFCAFYAVMRLVDDRIDSLSRSMKQCKETQIRELAIVDAWEQVVNSCHKGSRPTASQISNCDFDKAETVSESLAEAFTKFPIPLQLWTSFFNSMREDLIPGELESWTDFLDYAEGASVAPTTIYLYLISAEYSKELNSYKLQNDGDIFRSGHCLGIFAYIGHIVRDLAEDVTNTFTRLCIAREDMNLHRVSHESLRREAMNRQAGTATRELVKDLLVRARGYLMHGRGYIHQIRKILDKDTGFILDLIITMYERIIEKIEFTGYDPFCDQHRLTDVEKTRIVSTVAVQNEFPIPFRFENQVESISL